MLILVISGSKHKYIAGLLPARNVKSKPVSRIQKVLKYEFKVVFGLLTFLHLTKFLN
jgi:hypothetical protein